MFNSSGRERFRSGIINRVWNESKTRKGRSRAGAFFGLEIRLWEPTVRLFTIGFGTRMLCLYQHLSTALRTAGRLAPAFLLAMILLPANAQAASSRYERALLADKPAAYWRLNDSGAGTIRNLAPGANAESLNGMVQGKVLLRQPGPRPGAYPDFEPDATATAFSGKGDFIRIKDPGANSPVDFDKGDSITLQA